MFKRARLVLATWFTLALAVTLLAVGGVSYVLIRDDLDNEIDESLTSTVATVNDLDPFQDRSPGETHGPRGGGPSQASTQTGGEQAVDYDRLPPGVPSDVFIVYTDGEGSILGNPRGVDIDDVEFGDLCVEGSTDWSTSEVSTATGHYRFISLPDDRAGEWIHIGRSLEARDRQLRTLSMVFLIGGLGGVAASAAGGLWLAGVALKPIRASFERQRRFVSDASHELRTPLAVLRANGELLQRHPQDTVAQNIDQVDAITAEAEAMTKLVEDLLLLARADEGAANLAHEPVALGAVAEELGRDMEALAKQRGILLQVEAEPVEVVGDRHRLRQLGAILLDNALKYTPAGGTVSLRCARAGRWVELSVTDTGPGIPTAEQAKIFDRFVRADSARTRSAGGTGLGLAIAKWIAEAHGGRIAVESHPGHGARFTVRVPVSD